MVNEINIIYEICLTQRTNSIGNQSINYNIYLVLFTNQNRPKSNNEN